MCVRFSPDGPTVLTGRTKPHVFSWVIWGSTTLIVFFAQLADEGGAGAWPIGVSGLITIYVAVLAYTKRADTAITRSDWGFFAAAMMSLPAWFLTSDPLWAVIILTTVDVLGFGPTIRKAYARPYEEQLLFFVLMGIRNLISIAALENYSVTTVLFPAATAMAVVLFLVVVITRRRRVARSGP